MMKEAEIFAAPLSSSDEDSDNDENSAKPGYHPDTARPTPVPSSSRRKPLLNKGVRQSKRRKLQDEPDILDTTPETTPGAQVELEKTTQTEFDMLTSSSSQRRSQSKYGTKQYRRTEAPAQRNGSAQLKVPAALPDKPGTATRGPGALRVPAAPPPEKPSNTRRTSNTLTIPTALPTETAIKPKRVFKDYAAPAPSLPTPASSVDTSTTSPPAALQTTSPPSPNSPSITQETCPYCLLPITRSLLPDPTINLTTLRFAPLSHQANFCHQHTLADARRQYKHANYPVVDFATLPRRIERLLPILRKVLRREKASFWQDQLDELVRDKGDKKAVRRYVQDVMREGSRFPTGYLGGKGAQVMVEGIVRGLGKDLADAERGDGDDSSVRGGIKRRGVRVSQDGDGGKKKKKNKDDAGDVGVRAIGVGPYVSSVLVPECTMLLVMEDTGEGEDKAREVMRESAAVGMVVNAEDEVVDVEEAEGD